ncbi:tetratricopeptide repeat protein [Prevotella dentasini]|uniref:tetratricopeptide repeat protein n=1 Tax=Prevotella dentasini TaxID=589537 RepID=UPI000468FABB|nr:tetratricopeptide repeat protein [Prevotella dentasini]
MKKIIFLIILLFLPIAGIAQKKQIQAAREQLKAGKELEKAEKSMRDLLYDSIHRRNPKIWTLLCEILTRQYEQGNEKLYLKQKYDTTAFFSVTRRLFKTMESYDSIESVPDRTGKVTNKMRSRHSEYLHSIRPNLFNGGVFFIHRKDYQQAFDFFNDYIACSKLPLFFDYNYQETDVLMPHAAYWAMYCGYKLKSPELIVRHLSLAERDTSMLNFVRQYEAEAFLLQGDTAKYVNALKMGFNEYPNFAYFFPRLVEYYAHANELDSALEVADRALDADSTSILFRLTKSTVLLNMGRYEESIALCNQLIDKDEDFADGYYNIGLAYFNQAIKLDKERQTRSKHTKIEELYAKSLPYMERYRKLAPNEKDKWVPILYTIYLNLNMGKEFDEIDRFRNGNK